MSFCEANLCTCAKYGAYFTIYVSPVCRPGSTSEFEQCRFFSLKFTSSANSPRYINLGYSQTSTERWNQKCTFSLACIPSNYWANLLQGSGTLDSVAPVALETSFSPPAWAARFLLEMCQLTVVINVSGLSVDTSAYIEYFHSTAWSISQHRNPDQIM